MKLGTLEIQLLADIARLKQDMDAAKGAVGNAMAEVERSVGAAKSALFGLTGALVGIGSVAAFKGMVDGVIQSKVELQRLSVQTGASVESLSAISAVSKMTGTDIGTVGAAINKLQKNLSTSNEDSRGAAQAIAALGISFKEFKSLKADEQMLQVAKAMDQFQDGGGKSAAAMLLFGKTGAQLLPMLKDLADKNELVGKQTTASALQAEEYEKNLKRLEVMGNVWKRQMVEGMLPALTDITGAMVKARTEAGLFAGVMAGLDALGNHLFDWQGNAQRKNISNLKNDIAELKQSSGSLGLNIFGVKEDIAKEMEQKTKQLNSAMTEYFKLTNGSVGGGRGVVNPPMVKPKLDITVPDGAALKEGENFIKQLERQVVQQEKGKFSMLQLEAAQKGVSAQAGKYIVELEMIELRQDRIRKIVAGVAEQELQRGKVTGFIEQANSQAAAIIRETQLLGLNAQEQRRLTEMRKIDQEMQNAMVGASSETRQELLKLADTLKNNVGEALQEQIRRQNELNASWEYGSKTALEDYMREVNNVAAQTKNLMASSFKGMEDALVSFVKTGKLDFTSLADSIITDLIRIQVRQSIMKPLNQSLDASGGVGGLFSLVKGVFGYADGGIMSSAGPLPLRAYSGGGIADRPQMAMFGEGSVPEAYVPVPSGKIPVQLSGAGGGNVTIHMENNINAPNATAETVGQIRSLMPGFIAENARVVEGVVRQAMSRNGGRLPV